MVIQCRNLKTKKRVDNEGIEIVAHTMYVLPRPFGGSFLTTNYRQMRTKRSTTELIARSKQGMGGLELYKPFFMSEAMSRNRVQRST